MKKIISLIAVALIATGCATDPNDPNASTKKTAGIGALVGAAAGAYIGYKKDPTGGALRGAAVGAAAGGALGAGTGAYMDKQQADFNKELAAEKEANQIEVERLQGENLKITMNSEVSFDSGSSQLTPLFGSTLDKVANILNKYPQSTIYIDGHTDSQGSEAYNQKLSEERAIAVADALAAKGVDGARINTAGRGELMPRASNDTAEGRQLNRRVEMLIKPNGGIQ
jgi:outer membrane protein OmpA-like peptidoglycan-associated protein